MTEILSYNYLSKKIASFLETVWGEEKLEDI